MSAPDHVPVLPVETLAALDPKPGDVYLDCTAGLGGHAAAVGERLGPAGTVVLTDLDAGNLARAKACVEALPDAPRVVTIHANFAEAPRRLVELGLAAKLVLADLGFASTQVDDPVRGFSFQREGPLDMRLDASPGKQSAADLVNTLPERELADILHQFGEERASRAIAAKIVAERKTSPILTTIRLAEIVRSCVRVPPGPKRGIDPATRTFQALRIAVNDELGSLRAILDSVFRAASRLRAPTSQPLWLAPQARIALIAFHSLEDRPVKQAFADLTERGLAAPIGKRPTEATEDERSNNPRSRSAKLRAIRIL